MNTRGLEKKKIAFFVNFTYFSRTQNMNSEIPLGSKGQGRQKHDDFYRQIKLPGLMPWCEYLSV